MVIGRHIQTLPVHQRRRLAEAFDTGELPDRPGRTALRSALTLRGNVDGLLGDLSEDLADLARVGITGRAVAAWVRSVDEASAGVPSPDLVWSGPEVPGLPARDTRRVYEELFDGAKRSVWVSTYAYFDGPQAFAHLAQRLDDSPGLRVTILLNIQRARGDTTAEDQLVRRFTDQFWGKDWPGSSKPAVYYDPRSLDPSGPSGVLHAKAVVVDDEAVFVTSANLTEAAFDRNIELGVLIRHRILASSVANHFQALIDNRHLRPLPTS